MAIVQCHETSVQRKVKSVLVDDADPATGERKIMLLLRFQFLSYIHTYIYLYSE
jgi:hypothetical protein